MNRRSLIRTLTIAGAASLLVALFAEAPKKSDPEYTIRSDVRLVLLDVSVKDSSGGFVSGLLKDNFRVLENGRPQKITAFDNHDVPVTVGVIVDESLSMTPKRRDVLTGALTFLDESNPNDEVFVLNFNSQVARGLPVGTLFSDEPEQLRKALFRGLPQGKTALYDAVIAGLQQLELGRQERKCLVLISDGGDNASRHSRAEMLDMVERSIATIYTIGLFDPDDPDKDPRILARLAKVSGGAAFLPDSLKEMRPVCRKIAKDIRTRYTIGYVPAPDNGGNNSLRHIEVRASAPGHGKLITRSRTSYRYEEPDSQKAGQEK